MTASERIRQARIEALEAEIAWGREHPYAGVCGEDDARLDQLEALKEDQNADQG